MKKRKKTGKKIQCGCGMFSHFHKEISAVVGSA